MHLFAFTIKALTYTDVPARLADCTHSASIFRNRKTKGHWSEVVVHL